MTRFANAIDREYGYDLVRTAIALAQGGAIDYFSRKPVDMRWAVPGAMDRGLELCGLVVA